MDQVSYTNDENEIQSDAGILDITVVKKCFQSNQIKKAPHVP